jgi:IQ domain-containing protein H
MNIYTLCESISQVLYQKGVFGHVTIDLVSFPNPNDPKAHPLFWAVDINNELCDNANICSFFDILMEGNLDQETGDYAIEVLKDPDDEAKNEEDNNPLSNRVSQEPRSFMYCNFLHHPGLSMIQYKTFFHMCRLESISFDMEKRSGSTFCLFDSLQSGVIGMLTIGIHRKITVNYMIDALNFIQN